MSRVLRAASATDRWLVTRAALYLRVSTARQATEGVGLEAQEARCRAHAERMGWLVADVFRDEGISGRETLEGRPGLAALVDAAQKAPDVVCVVYSISRLARRQRLLWSLLDDRAGHGLVVSSATEPFDTSTAYGRAMLGMLGVFAQLEADMISERTKDALAACKARGVRLGRPSMELTRREIKALQRKGLTIPAIATTFGASERTIFRRLAGV